MTARRQTFLALAAVVLASLAAIKIGGRSHPAFAFCAFALLLVIAYGRLRMHLLNRKNAPPIPDAYERALRIQESRERRFRR